MKKYDSESHSGGEVAVISVARYGTLAGRVKAWFSQRSRYQLIMQALGQAQDDIGAADGILPACTCLKDVIESCIRHIA